MRTVRWGWRDLWACLPDERYGRRLRPPTHAGILGLAIAGAILSCIAPGAQVPQLARTPPSSTGTAMMVPVPSRSRGG